MLNEIWWIFSHMNSAQEIADAKKKILIQAHTF